MAMNQVKLTVKYQIGMRKPQTSNILVPTKIKNEGGEQLDEYLKECLAGEFKCTPSVVKLINDGPIKTEKFIGGEKEQKVQEGPLTVKQVQNLSKKELLEFAAAHEFEVDEKLALSKLQEAVAFLYKDKLEGNAADPEKKETPADK